MKHYDAYIIDSKEIFWAASMGRGSVAEAEKGAREHLKTRMEHEPNYVPKKLVIFECVACLTISL